MGCRKILSMSMVSILWRRTCWDLINEGAINKGAHSMAPIMIFHAHDGGMMLMMMVGKLKMMVVRGQNSFVAKK